MNRSIKFRAWDKSKSEMIYSGIEFELRAINYPSKYGDNNAWGSDTIGFMNTNEEYFDVMQFTGLTDKNGKEVYEGDIVKVTNKPYSSNKPTVVVWGTKSFGWSLKFDCGKHYEHNPLIKYYSLPSSKNIEVIGNIYENPELLS